MKKVLLYGLDEIGLNALRSAGEELGIAVYVIGDAQIDGTVREVFEVEEDGDDQHLQESHAFCIFQELSKDEILKFVRSAQNLWDGFDVVLAARTDVNQDWTVRRLMQETQQESVVLKKAWELGDVLRSVDPKRFAAYPVQLQEEIKPCLMESYMLLKSGQYTEEELQKAITSLREVLENADRSICS